MSDRDALRPTLAQLLSGLKRTIRAERLARGWTQDHMAELMGTSQSQYSSFESDGRRYDVHLSSLFRAAHVLGLTLEVRMVAGPDRLRAADPDPPAE